MNYPEILHHGAVNGVTGSCHELQVDSENSILIDCGLFQGAEISDDGSAFDKLVINFPFEQIQALVVTHCHIDHVGRIPYLLAAGFDGPIYCSEPSAVLLPLVLEDAVKIGFARDERLINKFTKLLTKLIVPIPYNQWQPLKLSKTCSDVLDIKLSPAGHILGSAFVQCRVNNQQHITFSGDLGGPDTPLLPDAIPPKHTDILVLESTYGNKNHDQRKQRKKILKKIIIKCLENEGVILVPAFSIGRTQELLYELEEIIHQSRGDEILKDLYWNDLEIIVDSPLASKFTNVYKKLEPYWDEEATVKVENGRHPLSFEQLTTINSHREHLQTVEYLKKTARPCIVLAASGMCTGGRIINYLKALIEDKRTDILFTGYQASGTTGRFIQKYGKNHGYVEMDRQRYNINAEVYTLSGYSAHAGQDALIDFVKNIEKKPNEIRLIHGSDNSKKALKEKLQALFSDIKIWIP